jgi:hypothetical protein
MIGVVCDETPLGLPHASRTFSREINVAPLICHFVFLAKRLFPDTVFFYRSIIFRLHAGGFSH